jgi:predicted CopG family antitoxin
METTTIQVSVETYQWLNSQKRPGESFEDVLRRLREGDGESAAQKATEPAESLPEELELPGSGETLERRRKALARLYRYLQQEETATREEFLELVDAEDVGYASAESYWSNAVKGRDSFRVLPGVESPGEGEHTWRYSE